MIEDEINSINKPRLQNIRFLLCDITGNVRQAWYAALGWRYSAKL
jgi:hypothetical protein